LVAKLGLFYGRELFPLKAELILLQRAAFFLQSFGIDDGNRKDPETNLSISIVCKSIVERTT
jgi:hypothetical protein